MTENKKMKVAVCYSGMFRNFNETIENHMEHLYSKYDCDIYFSFWDVYGDGGFTSKYTLDKRTTWDFKTDKFYETEVSNDKISQSDIDDVIKRLNPVRYEFQDFSKFGPLFNSKSELLDHVYGEVHDWLPHLPNIMSMYYKIYRCNYLVKYSGREYDCVLRMRSDLMFHDFGLELLKPEPNTININSWGSFRESYQDMLIHGDMIGMGKLARLYFNLEKIWHESGRKSANEKVLHYYLNEICDANINTDSSIEFYKVNRGNLDSMADHYIPKEIKNL
jgi:hypothetical protein